MNLRIIMFDYNARNFRYIPSAVPHGDRGRCDRGEIMTSLFSLTPNSLRPISKGGAILHSTSVNARKQVERTNRGREHCKC